MFNTRAVRQTERHLRAGVASAARVGEEGTKWFQSLIPTASYQDFAIIKRLFLWMFLNVAFCFMFPSLYVLFCILFSSSPAPNLATFVTPALLSFALIGVFNLVVAYSWKLSLSNMSTVRRLMLGLLFAVCFGASQTNLMHTFGFQLQSSVPITFYNTVTILVYFRSAMTSKGSSDIILQPACPNLSFEIKRVFFCSIREAFTRSVFISCACFALHILLYSSQYIVYIMDLLILELLEIFFTSSAISYFAYCTWGSSQVQLIIHFLLRLSGSNILSPWHTVNYSFLTSFYVYSMASASTSFLKAFVFYPLDFKKLQANHTSPQYRDNHSHQYMVDAMAPDQLSDVDKLAPEQKGLRGNKEALWRRLLLAQQKLSDEQFKDITRPEYSGAPRLKYLLGKRNSLFENIRKILAYQDFARCVSCCKKQRFELYNRYVKDTGDTKITVHALQNIAYESSTLINAVTLQLQIMIAHAIVEVFPEPQSPMNRGPIYPTGPLADHWNGSVNWAAQEMAQNDKKRRDSTIAGSFLRKLYGLKYIGVFVKFVFGSVVTTVPIPYAVVQQIAYASEGLSCALLYALREDQEGFCYSYVPVVVSSLIGLQIAVQDYYNMLQRSVHVAGGAPFICRSEMPVELKALMNASEDALNRIFHGYQDTIKDFAFPDIYAVHISDRLNRM